MMSNDRMAPASPRRARETLGGWRHLVQRRYATFIAYDAGMESAVPLPMFPLGRVLFPYELLPLQVFEPRYLAMVRDLREGNGEFGVVLIERGFEVGGGDQRFTVGTAARIARVEETEPGRCLVLAVGLRRVRVTAWLPDDPYPLARVAAAPDAPAPIGGVDGIARVEAGLERVRALHAAAGADIPDALPDLHGDPGVALFQACALAPVGPLDCQRLLEADGFTGRLALLEELLADAEDLLRLRLANE